MRKYLSIILMCLFLSIPISAQEYVSNGIKQSQAVAVLPKPKLAIYVDNRLYNNTLIGTAMISKEGNLMIPSNANVVKDCFTSRAIEFTNG